MRLLGAISLLLITSNALGDYGWIPPHKDLRVKLGGEYSRSSENFSFDRTREDIVFQNQKAALSQWRFTIEPEYGFADDWSFYFKGGFLTNKLDANTTVGGNLLKGSGAGDIHGAIKRRVKNALPLMTLEAFFKIPTYSQTPPDNTTLVRGDGNFDLGFLLHMAYKPSNYFFSLSPGVLFRFSGYAQAILLKAAVGMRFYPAHFVLFSDGIFSLTEAEHLDSSLTRHDAPGSGGSYARLSASPQGWAMGVKTGVAFHNHYGFEAYFAHALWGKRYPNFFQVGLNVTAAFDFFEEDIRPKLKKVPFEEG